MSNPDDVFLTTKHATITSERHTREGSKAAFRRIILPGGSTIITGMNQAAVLFLMRDIPESDRQTFREKYVHNGSLARRDADGSLWAEIISG